MSKKPGVNVDVLRKSMMALSLDRDEFVRRQGEKMKESRRGYVLADNMLLQFPYLRVNGEFVLPLPYLLKSAVTVGVLHRIASGSDVGLRSDIGKKIIEDYVVRLMRHSGFYDQVSSERRYQRGGMDSPDVIAYKDGKCVLMEVKFKEPTLRLRTLKPEDEQPLDSSCAQAIAQVYRGMCDRSKYLKERDFCDENVFGVVVLFEEPNLSRENVFNELMKLHPEWESATFEYVKRHVRIVCLYDIEIICSRHHGVFDVLEHYRDGDAARLHDRSFFLLDAETEKLDVFGLDDMVEYATKGFEGLLNDSACVKTLR